MSHVSLKLAKKVYEAFGWGKGDEHMTWVVIYDHDGSELDTIPEYTTDYLLDQLASRQSDYNIKLYYSIVGRTWGCSFDRFGGRQTSDTAADAVAKLALWGKNEGILG